MGWQRRGCLLLGGIRRQKTGSGRQSGTYRMIVASDGCKTLSRDRGTSSWKDEEDVVECVGRRGSRKFRALGTTLLLMA